MTESEFGEIIHSGEETSADVYALGYGWIIRCGIYTEIGRIWLNEISK